MTVYTTSFIFTYQSAVLMKQKALLLYSGGLDTSVMIKWLQEKLNYEVATLTLDVGQEKNDLENISLKAKKLGAFETVTKDVTAKFAEHYISKGILGDALYQGVYPLSTSLARPLMAKEAVEAAQYLECDTIVHGSTGKGNDQVRFEVSIRALDDSLKILAPVREMNMNRDDEILYARKNGIDVPYGGKYSVDENLWGRSVEGSTIEDIGLEVPFDAFRWVTPPELSPDKAETISISFENGLPVSLNGEPLDLSDLISAMNRIAGSNGIGSIDAIEDRLVGIKSHEFYECPAAISIIKAHKYLESAVLNRKELALKTLLDSHFSEYTYNGLWFDPVMDHINLMERSFNSAVNGTVKLKLYRGNIVPSGIESDSAIYDLKMSGYGRNQVFDQNKSPGFIYIFGNETAMTKKARSVNQVKADIRT